MGLWNRDDVQICTVCGALTLNHSERLFRLERLRPVPTRVLGRTESEMAKARKQTRTTTETILRRLENARKQFEQTFERAIRSVKAEVGTGARRASAASN